MEIFLEMFVGDTVFSNIAILIRYLIVGPASTISISTRHTNKIDTLTHH